MSGEHLFEFRVCPLSEAAFDELIAAAGGSRAHPDADTRQQRGADYRLNEAIIELKILDDEGLSKPERQQKLALLFGGVEPPARPVIVLDRARLPDELKLKYDNIIEGPIKSAVRSAKKQLSQSRSEFPDTTTSILVLVNSGNTALTHEEIVALTINRAKNYREIDGIVIAGCYLFGDTFDHFCLFPIDYLPLNLERPFSSFDTLKRAWDALSEKIMTDAIVEENRDTFTKGRVIDTEFKVGSVTFVRRAPPIGSASGFFKERPRKNSAGLKQCPPVAVTFADLAPGEWEKFLEHADVAQILFATYRDWLRHRDRAKAEGTALQPFVPMPISFDDWMDWRAKREDEPDHSVATYANELFSGKVRAIIEQAREYKATTVFPSRYVLVVTEEIGQDRANDVSHFALAETRVNAEPLVTPLNENARAFHEHALAVAAAYALSKNVDHILWVKEQAYVWR